MSLIRIGGNVDAWCTRCKLVLAHTIEAAVGSDIKRVHCNTCKSKHTYRTREPGATVVKSIKSKATPCLARASHYDAILKNRDVTNALSYSFRNHYNAGQVVAHKEFGVGIVTADKGSHKIEVLFQAGPKILVHDRI